MDTTKRLPAFRRAAHDGRTKAAGFTLVELLISLVLFTVIVSSALDLLMSQRRLTDAATTSISLQSNVRAAADLMASELRTVPDGSVLAGTGDSVVVRYPYRWGLICTATGGGSPQPDADVYMPTDDPLFAGMTPAGVAVRDDDTGAWTYWDDTSEPWTDSLYVESTVACLEGPGASVEPGDTAQAPYRRWTGYESYTGAEAAQGDQVIAYTVVTYRFGESVFEPGTRALFRVTSAGEQELAGFFADDSGFRYVMDDGAVHTTLPVGREDDVARIRILARTTAASRDGGEDDAFTYDARVDIHLRNTGTGS